MIVVAAAVRSGALMVKCLSFDFEKFDQSFNHLRSKLRRYYKGRIALFKEEVKTREQVALISKLLRTTDFGD